MRALRWSALPEAHEGSIALLVLVVSYSSRLVMMTTLARPLDFDSMTACFSSGR